VPTSGFPFFFCGLSCFFVANPCIFSPFRDLPGIPPKKMPLCQSQSVEIGVICGPPSSVFSLFPCAPCVLSLPISPSPDFFAPSAPSARESLPPGCREVPISGFPSQTPLFPQLISRQTIVCLRQFVAMPHGASKPSIFMPSRASSKPKPRRIAQEESDAHSNQVKGEHGERIAAEQPEAEVNAGQTG